MKKSFEVNADMIKKIYERFDDSNSTMYVETDIAPNISDFFVIKSNLFKKILNKIDNHTIQTEILDINITQYQHEFEVDHKVTNGLYTELQILMEAEQS